MMLGVSGMGRDCAAPATGGGGPEPCNLPGRDAADGAAERSGSGECARPEESTKPSRPPQGHQDGTKTESRNHSVRVDDFRLTLLLPRRVLSGAGDLPAHDALSLLHLTSHLPTC